MPNGLLNNNSVSINGSSNVNGSTVNTNTSILANQSSLPRYSHTYQVPQFQQSPQFQVPDEINHEDVIMNLLRFLNDWRHHSRSFIAVLIDGMPDEVLQDVLQRLSQPQHRAFNQDVLNLVPFIREVLEERAQDDMST